MEDVVKSYDVVVIGAGVVGAAVARELSRYELKVAVLEKEEDVCSGTSKANSGIVHAGHDAKPGTNKAKFNIEGSRMMPELAKELDFEFENNGSLVLCFDDDDRYKLGELLERGNTNGVTGLKIIEGDEVRRIEPEVSEEVVAALYVPTGGIVCPFGLTIALAENACDNGVEFKFLTKVENVKKYEEGFVISTNKGEIKTKYIVNAAGVYADVIHNFVSNNKLKINPRKGDYCLLDKGLDGFVKHTVFQLPGKKGKGILVTPTVHGNPMLGPTATEIDDKEGNETTLAELDYVIEMSGKSVKNVPFRQIITSFSGLRAAEAGGDFVVGEARDCEGFFDAAGIESPGLTSAPAIGKYLAEQIADKAGAGNKTNWNGKRKGIVKAALLPIDERVELIKKNSKYGKIICRCEEISEGEIIDAITRTLGATSLDGLKRRVRQGAGRCQAGFCTQRAMELLFEYAAIPTEKVCKNSPGSELLVAKEGR
ncbi:MAG: NAD(P)/FAD-dependent oxidoreductase [Catonella sp.]